MQKLILISILALLMATGISFGAENEAEPIRPVHTYSIVCFDTLTGQFGAAVQSHYFKVADVIWLEPGVGAVATQSLVDFAYGPLGLEMMKKGKTAKQALDGLLASDPNNNVRQVAMIDRNGVIATHTGNLCIAEAGHYIGPNYSVQANLMRNNTVWRAMSEAFEATEGDLAEKMMAALESAQAEGGDIRGSQSAAMVVVTGQPTGKSWVDRQIDIRVDDSPEPLKELRRLLDITRAYKHLDLGDEYITAGDFDKANIEYAMAAELSPDNLEIKYWHAVTLATINRLDEALPIFKEIFAKDNSWRELIPRLVKSEILPDDKEIIEKIMSL
ncbi:MAG: DUF1028 domain-containing protein [Candidatus Zixiibacteriota bacterium]